MTQLSERGMFFNSKLKLESLESLWSPLLILMKAAGLYHYQDNCRWWRSGWKLHSCLVFIHVFGMSVLYMITSFSSIAGRDGQQARQFESIVDMLWFAVMLGFSASLFLASHNPKKLRAFYRKWLEFRLVPDICEVHVAIKKQTWFITLFISIVTPLLWIAIAYYRTLEGHNICFVLANFVLECVEMFSLAFFILVFTTLCTVTSFANNQFLKFLKNPEKMLHQRWEMCRLTYVLVIELIDLADNFLCFPVGWSVLCYVAQLTFYSFAYVLYVFNEKSNLISYINSAIWTLVLILSLFFILWKASAVHNEIHSTFSDMNKLKIGVFSLSMQNELIFLQNRLGNSCIGISIFKVHLITRNFTSSIVSAYLTYLIILLQFKDSK